MGKITQTVSIYNLVSLYPKYLLAQMRGFYTYVGIATSELSDNETCSSKCNEYIKISLSPKIIYKSGSER